MAPLRLCLAVECTAKAGAQWPTTLRQVVEPALALAEACSSGGAAQLALVTFGAAPPHSPAAVESVLGWVSVQRFRHLLDSLEFAGGGGRQPVALAEALAEAAALFAVAGAAGGGGGPWQQHCLICLASEPAVHAVAWPFPEDCCLASGVQLGAGAACHGASLLLGAMQIATCAVQAATCAIACPPPPPNPAGSAARHGDVVRAAVRAAAARRAAGTGWRRHGQQPDDAAAPGKLRERGAAQVGAGRPKQGGRPWSHARQRRKQLLGGSVTCGRKLLLHLVARGSSRHAAHHLHMSVPRSERKAAQLHISCSCRNPAAATCRSLAGLRQDQLSGRPDGVLPRTRRCLLMLPGRGMAFLPFWPEASEVGWGSRWRWLAGWLLPWPRKPVPLPLVVAAAHDAPRRIVCS